MNEEKPTVAEFLGHLCPADPNEDLSQRPRRGGVTIEDIFLHPKTPGGFVLDDATPARILEHRWRCERADFPVIVVASAYANAEVTAFIVDVDARNIERSMNTDATLQWLKAEAMRNGGRIEYEEPKSIRAYIDVGPSSREEAIALARALARRCREQLEAPARP